MKETFKVKFWYSLNDNTREFVSVFTVEIDEKDPITKASDMAEEMLYQKHDGSEVNIIDFETTSVLE